MQTVFANGIWKSGNHLIEKIILEMPIPRGTLGIGTSLLIGNHKLIRAFIRGSYVPGRQVEVGLESPAPVSKRWLIKSVKKNKGKLISGHAAYSGSLHQIMSENNVKMIQIIRDPRDIITSFAHWIPKAIGYFPNIYFSNLSFNERCKVLIEGRTFKNFYFEPLFSVLDRSYGWLTNNDITVIRFERLVGPFGGGLKEHQVEEIQKIAKSMQYDISNTECEAISNNCFGGTSTFRSGKIDSWKMDLSPEIKLLAEKSFGNRLQQWGYC